jgi:nicotinamidase-related amidase
MTADSKPFLEWLTRWEGNLPEVDVGEVIPDPAGVALISVDLTNGFCCKGPLASPRVARIVPAAVHLFHRVHDLGVRHFLLLQDTHDADAIEFFAYPPHAVAGTTESATIDELKNLPFSHLFVVMPKNSVSCDIGTDLGPWLEAHPAVTTFIVVGDCTDICVYLAAMYLRLRANVLGLRDVRVIVPADCVQTYDMSVATAEELGALPHDGDLLHRVFLCHMALNGIQVVAHLT